MTKSDTLPLCFLLTFRLVNCCNYLNMRLPSVDRNDEKMREPSGKRADEAETAVELKQRRMRELLKKIEELSWRTYLEHKSRVAR
jgi:hypothetical protein